MARILLVEDDVELARLLGHVLASAGYQVEQAATVADARSALDADSYDLALVDARLPDGTGMDVADCAAQHGTRALIVTGYAFAYPELRDYEYLLKPVRPDELVREVGQARSTTRPGCARRGISGLAANSLGSRSPRRTKSLRNSLPRANETGHRAHAAWGLNRRFSVFARKAFGR